MRNIRVVRIPTSAAPVWARVAWIGCEFFAEVSVPDDGEQIVYLHDEVPSPVIGPVYAVPAEIAVAALEEKDFAAARFWESALHAKDATHMAFPCECCELV